MRHVKSRGILVGAGLLGVGAIMSFAQPASAQPRRNVRAARQDVNEARRDMRAERQDVRQADTPREQRQETRELTAAQRKLQREQQDLQRERQQRQWQQQQWQRQPGYRAPSDQSRPYYQNHAFRTLEGRIINDLKGDRSCCARTTASSCACI
jgi:TolA-binding protein